MHTELNAVFPKLFHQETVAMTDSLKVAEVFGKRHDNILQALKNLDCSDEFRLLNFQESFYLNEQGKRQPKVNMTQDGFTFLVMGFRGKKAATFKEAYIKRFNEMRDWISKRAHLSSNQHILNDAIKLHCKATDTHAYSRENNLIYIAALGATRKQWLENKLLPAEAEIRSYLNASELQLVERLTVENAVMIKLGLNYNARRMRLLETALQERKKEQ